MRTRLAPDIIALLARCAVGVVFLVHGWQKVESGVNATAVTFGSMGVPLAKAAAVYSTFVELLGGAALIAGLGLPLTGLLLFIDMAGAFTFVHYDQSLTGPEGSELVLVLAAVSLLFATGSGGRLTVDHALSLHRRRTAELAELAEDFPLLPDTDETPGASRPAPTAAPAPADPAPETPPEPRTRTRARSETQPENRPETAGGSAENDTVPEIPAPGDVVVAGPSTGTGTRTPRASAAGGATRPTRTRKKKTE